MLIVISNWVINEGMWAAMKKYLDGKASRQDAMHIINLMADSVNEGLEQGYIKSYVVDEKVIVTSRVLMEEGHMHHLTRCMSSLHMPLNAIISSWLTAI